MLTRMSDPDVDVHVQLALLFSVTFNPLSGKEMSICVFHVQLAVLFILLLN